MTNQQDQEHVTHAREPVVLRIADENGTATAAVHEVNPGPESDRADDTVADRGFRPSMHELAPIAVNRFDRRRTKPGQIGAVVSGGVGA